MTQESMFSQQEVYPLMYVARSSVWVERHSGELLQRLSDEGFVVHVLASDDGGFERLSRRGIVARPLPVGWSANMVGLFGGYVIMQAYFLEQRPVLVHAFDQPLAWVTTFAARRAEVPSIVASVGRHHLVNWEKIPAMEEVFARAYGLLNRKVNAYVVGSESERELAERLGIAGEDHVEVIGGDDAVEQTLRLYDRLLSDVLS